MGIPPNHRFCRIGFSKTVKTIHFGVTRHLWNPPFRSLTWLNWLFAKDIHLNDRGWSLMGSNGWSFVNLSLWFLTQCLVGSSAIQTYPGLLYAAYCIWVNQLTFQFWLVTTCTFFARFVLCVGQTVIYALYPIWVSILLHDGIYITALVIQMPFCVGEISVFRG